MKIIKLKSFGITEALIASVIIILILSSAVALSSSSIRVATKNDTYAIAGQIANEILENVSSAKESARVSFNDESSTSVFPIECFDSTKYNNLECNASQGFIDYGETNSDGYVKFTRNIESYVPDFFNYRVSVLKPDEIGESGCPGLFNGEPIPGQMCRYVKVDVQWADSSGIISEKVDRNYVVTQYFTNW